MSETRSIWLHLETESTIVLTDAPLTFSLSHISSAASFKIIPRDSADGESPLVTLVVWNKEATNMIRTWKVRLQDSKAIQILMFYRTDSPSVEPLGIYNRRSNFHIRNLSNGGLKHVLVFQDAGLNVAYSRRRGQVYTP